MLDIGLLAVAFKRDSWAVVEPLTLAGAYAVYAGWRPSSVASAKLDRNTHPTAPAMTTWKERKYNHE